MAKLILFCVLTTAFVVWATAVIIQFFRDDDEWPPGGAAA